MATSEMRDAGAAAAAAAAADDEGEDPGVAMTLVEHLDELRRRLLISLAAVAVGSLLGFLFWQRILDFLLLPLPSAATHVAGLSRGPGQRLVVHDIGEPFMIALKLAVAVGLL